MNASEIISALPYQSPFLFVDDLTAISENGISGNYTFKKEAFFYQGHFKNNPITPGVILTETMAQIGVVCLGIFLIKDKISLGNEPEIALTSHQIDFYIPVYPQEKVMSFQKKHTFALTN